MGEEGPNPELIDFMRRLWLCVAVAVSLVLLTMSPLIVFPLREWIGERLSVWVELILALPVVLRSAQPFFKRAWQSLLYRSPNIWTLIGIGVATAYGFIVMATLLPSIFPPSFSTMSGQFPVYYEAAVVIIALVYCVTMWSGKSRSMVANSTCLTHLCLYK